MMLSRRTIGKARLPRGTLANIQTKELIEILKSAVKFGLVAVCVLVCRFDCVTVVMLHKVIGIRSVIIAQLTLFVACGRMKVINFEDFCVELNI